MTRWRTTGCAVTGSTMIDCSDEGPVDEKVTLPIGAFYGAARP
jgi:hypothetical protein